MLAIIGAGAIGQLWADRALACMPTKRTAHAPNSSICFLTTRPLPAKTVVIKTHPKTDALDRHTLLEQQVQQWSLSDVPTSTLAALDAIFICTKSYDAHKAAIALNHCVPQHIPFVLFQNGMGSQQAIEKDLTDRPLFVASTTAGANISKEGILRFAGEGKTLIGPFNERAKELGADMPKMLSGLHPYFTFETDIEPMLWRKLLVNCGINAITAIEDCTNGEISRTDTFHSVWNDLIKELVVLSIKAQVPAQNDFVEKMILDVTHGTSGNISSMLQDVRRGRRTEVDAINGFAADTIESMGYHAPINRHLVRRVHALGY